MKRTFKVTLIATLITTLSTTASALEPAEIWNTIHTKPLTINVKQAYDKLIPLLRQTIFNTKYTHDKRVSIQDIKVLQAKPITPTWKILFISADITITKDTNTTFTRHFTDAVFHHSPDNMITETLISPTGTHYKQTIHPDFLPAYYSPTRLLKGSAIAKHKIVIIGDPLSPTTTQTINQLLLPTVNTTTNNIEGSSSGRERDHTSTDSRNIKEVAREDREQKGETPKGTIAVNKGERAHPYITDDHNNTSSDKEKSESASSLIGGIKDNQENTNKVGSSFTTGDENGVAVEGRVGSRGIGRMTARKRVNKEDHIKHQLASSNKSDIRSVILSPFKPTIKLSKSVVGDSIRKKWVIMEDNRSKEYTTLSDKNTPLKVSPLKTAIRAGERVALSASCEGNNSSDGKNGDGKGGVEVDTDEILDMQNNVIDGDRRKVTIAVKSIGSGDGVYRKVTSNKKDNHNSDKVKGAGGLSGTGRLTGTSRERYGSRNFGIYYYPHPDISKRPSSAYVVLVMEVLRSKGKSWLNLVRDMGRLKIDMVKSSLDEVVNAIREQIGYDITIEEVMEDKSSLNRLKKVSGLCDDLDVGEGMVVYFDGRRNGGEVNGN